MGKIKTEKSVEIPKLNIETFKIKIIGDSSLIVHAWSTKAKIMMLDKMTKKATKAKETRRPVVEFADSLYWLTEKPNLDGLTDEEAQAVLNEVIPKSKFGFPSRGFKLSVVNGGFQQGALVKSAGGADLAKTTARGAFFVLNEFAEINGIPTIREDMVRVGMGSADIRYRAEFKTWDTTLTIKYNTSAISMEQIINLFNIGGFSNGVGEERPEKDGMHGTYHVE